MEEVVSLNLNNFWIDLEEAVKEKIEDFKFDKDKVYVITCNGRFESYFIQREEKPSDNEIIGDCILNDCIFEYEFKVIEDLKVFLRSIGETTINLKVKE